jgi:6-phosphogluconolactonase
MTEPVRAAAKISLVLADVDGTLVTAEKVLTPRAAAAVKALQAADIAFAITSGRPPRGMAMLIDPLALSTPIAGFNGGIFVKPDMTVMAEHVLAVDIARRALDIILHNGLDAWIYSGQDWLVRNADAPHVAREQWTVKFPPTVIESFKDAIGSAVKIVGVSDDLDLVARCEKDAQDALGAGASAARSQPYYLDVTHPDANKGSVVTTLSKLLSVPAGEIATIGDMPNDVLMFRNSGLSIAMGNASPDVQEQADVVTDSYNDEGFAKAMERFILQHTALPRRLEADRDICDIAACEFESVHDEMRGVMVMTDAPLADIRTFENAETLARNVAQWLRGLAQASSENFAVCLSGGSTPRRLYEHLADRELASHFPWSRVHWFWGDERFVPHDHPDSNYRMVRDALLSRAPIPDGNIHAIPTEGLSPEQAAAAYETTLKRFYGAETLAPDRPLFDVTLLGIGEDGHTASLFPGQPALQEMRRWAVAVIGAKSEPRITLTYPTLDSGRDVAFLATGEGKRDAVARARSGDRTMPATLVRPVGRLHWFADRGAAASVN